MPARAARVTAGLLIGLAAHALPYAAVWPTAAGRHGTRLSCRLRAIHDLGATSADHLGERARVLPNH